MLPPVVAHCWSPAEQLHRRGPVFAHGCPGVDDDNHDKSHRRTAGGAGGRKEEQDADRGGPTHCAYVEPPCTPSTARQPPPLDRYGQLLIRLFLACYENETILTSLHPLATVRRAQKRIHPNSGCVSHSRGRANRLLRQFLVKSSISAITVNY